MTDENVRVEIKVCSYHIGEICGVPTIYLTDPPIKGEPTCELIKKTRIDDRIICSIRNDIKLDYFKNLRYNINNEERS